MAIDIYKLIAAISPDTYCEEWTEEDGKQVSLRDKVKAVVKEKGYAEASKIAKLRDFEPLDEEDLAYATAIDAGGLKAPIEKHVISYDATGENLEPIYFWLLDYLNTDFKKSKSVDKLVDNFISSAGSAQFSEMGMKATKMQDEAMKLLGSANQVIKSIINILYDLKEFKQRLELYKQATSEDKEKSEKGVLSLKQVWLDTVDMKRGNTAIKQMAVQYQYVTLIDAFFAAKSESDVQKLDINDRVKRILEQRVNEFYIWLKESKNELERRFNIEKIYLKSQVNSVKIYSRWIKPYLKAAQDLEQRGNNALSASLVTAFSTTMFELTLLAKGEYDLRGDVARGELPKMFDKAKKRNYWAMMLVELKFRTIPGRIGNNSNYVYRGKVDATFTSFALNDDEIKVFKETVENDNLQDLNKLIGGATEQSLALLMDEIKEYMDEDDKEGKPKESKEPKKSSSDDVNPFSALFDGLFNLFSSDKKEDKSAPVDLSKGIPKDNDVEKVIRSQAVLQARGECSKMYGLFKKAQGMSA
jgi:hypothetical protein